MTDDGGFFLEPERRLSRWWWLILGVAGILLFAAGGLALVLGVGHFFQEPATEALPTMTLVPTFTPRPAATVTPPMLTLAARPWTNDRAPVGLVEVTLSLPAAAQVSHQPPPGFRYWRGDLLQTRQGLGWSGADGGEVRWYLFREPGAVLTATLEVTVNGQRLTIDLQPATPATVSAVLEE